MCAASFQAAAAEGIVVSTILCSRAVSAPKIVVTVGLACNEPINVIFGGSQERIALREASKFAPFCVPASRPCLFFFLVGNGVVAKKRRHDAC